jgi:hypothetical protein
MFVVLASCSPQKRLARLLEQYPLKTDTVVKYKDTTIFRDALVIKHIPGETIYRDTLIPFKVDLPYMELKTTSMFADARAWIWENRLGLEIIQHDTFFQFKLDSALRQDIDSIFVETVREIPVIEKANPFWKHGFLVLAGLLLLAMTLFFVFRK